jgi:hypothetical protein
MALDREALLQIIREAAVNVAKRPAGRRGPFVFDENELQQLAATLAQHAGEGEAEPVAVKPLTEWRRGYCDDRVTIEQASFGGMYQVRVLDGVVWLDWPGQRKEEFPSVEAAKAAANAEYERAILSALAAPHPHQAPEGKTP